MLFRSLEDRFLYSGAVNITYSDNAVIIQGDAFDNHIALSLDDDGYGDPPTGILVGVSDNTNLRFNGVDRHKTGDSLTDRFDIPIILDLGTGNDSIYFGNPSFGNSVIRLGEGNDIIKGQAQFSNLSIDSGSGDDFINLIGETVITGNMSIISGAGRDRIKMGRVNSTGPQIGGKLLILDTSGPTSVFLDRVYVRRQSLISTFNSIDRITIQESSFRGSLTLGTRGGDDIIDLTGSFFRSSKDIFAGAGNNTIIP